MTKSTYPRILSYLFFMSLSILILGFSLMRQSDQQAKLHLGLSVPDPVRLNPSSIEIVVPSHGNFSLSPPSLLPNHPLYPFLMIYDRIKLVTTLNPQRKLRLLLEYSNTRMSAANRLADQGLTSLAITTATKGQNYLWQTIQFNQSISMSDPDSWFDLLSQSLLKHEEVLEKLIFISTGQPRSQANFLWEQLAYYRNQVVSLSGVPFQYPRPEDELTP